MTSTGSMLSAGHVLEANFKIVPTLSRAQLVVEFRGLRVDDIGPNGACVAPEQGVIKRTVAPVEPAEMQSNEKDGNRTT